MSKNSGGTSIMGLSKKFVIFFAIASLPVMVMYQNCSKTQSFDMQDVSAFKGEGGLDSILLPSSDGEGAGPGSETNHYQVEPRDEPSDEPSDPPVGSLGGEQQAPPTAPGSEGSGPSPLPALGNEGSDPEFLADCSEYTNQSQNPNPDASFSNDSASGVQGYKVLTPEDFAGNRQIKSISDTGGYIVLCNLEVEDYSNHNGRIDLVNSHAVFSGVIPKNIKYFSGK